MRSLLRIVTAAVLSAAIIFTTAAHAGADTGDGSSGGAMSPANINSMFGPGGDVSNVSDGGGGDLVDSGMSLGDVSTSGALSSADAAQYVTDQQILLDNLTSAQQMSTDALRAAEQARLDSQRKRRGKLPASVPYAAEFEAAGERYGVDPALLAAVAQAESGFDPAVISCARSSSAGARGIMQFMPATAAGRGIDPCNPAQAIDAGAAFLSELYARFGDWDIALAAYNWGPERSSIRDRNTWPSETKAYVAAIRSSWSSYAQMMSSEAQGEVGPEGCPTTAAANTLRNGAESVGVYEICRRSVEAARSPEAAKAIKAALSPEFLGKPYSQPKRNSAGWYDCSSFVTRAYSAGGTILAKPGQNAPTTATMQGGYPWTQRISLSEARPGDLVFPTNGHVAMVLADGWAVHTNRTGDVSHVRRMYTSAVATIAVIPSAA